MTNHRSQKGPFHYIYIKTSSGVYISITMESIGPQINNGKYREFNYNNEKYYFSTVNCKIYNKNFIKVDQNLDQKIWDYLVEKYKNNVNVDDNESIPDFLKLLRNPKMMRDKRNCKYYENGYCSKQIMCCTGSRHCDYYQKV